MVRREFTVLWLGISLLTNNVFAGQSNDAQDTLAMMQKIAGNAAWVLKMPVGQDNTILGGNSSETIEKKGFWQKFYNKYVARVPSCRQISVKLSESNFFAHNAPSLDIEISGVPIYNPEDAEWRSYIADHEIFIKILSNDNAIHIFKGNNCYDAIFKIIKDSAGSTVIDSCQSKINESGDIVRGCRRLVLADPNYTLDVSRMKQKHDLEAQKIILQIPRVPVASPVINALKADVISEN